MVCLQSPQRGFALPDYVESALALCVRIDVVHRPMNLCCEEALIPSAANSQSLSRNSFAGAASINIGRIQEVDPGIQSGVNDTEGLIVLRSPSKIHASQAKRTDMNPSAAQSAVFHGCDILFSYGVKSRKNANGLEFAAANRIPAATTALEVRAIPMCGRYYLKTPTAQLAVHFELESIDYNP